MLDVMSFYIVRQVQYLAELHEGELTATDEVQRQQLLHCFRPQQQFTSQPATHWAPWPHFTLPILDTRPPSLQPLQGEPNEDERENEDEGAWNFSDEEDNTEVDAQGNPTLGSFHNLISMDTDPTSTNAILNQATGSSMSTAQAVLTARWEEFRNNPGSI